MIPTRSTPVTAGCLLAERARASPDATAMTDLVGCRVTYAELEAAASTLSAELDRLDAWPRAPVAVVMPNSMQATVAAWGALTSSRPLAVLHPSLPEPALRQALAALGAVAVLRPGSGTGARDRPRLELRTATADPDTDLPPGLPRSLRPALLICTSGTTGRPKIIVCSHEQVTWSTAAISRALAYRPSDVVACVPPFSFDYGLYQLLLAAAAGSAVLVDPRLDSAQAVVAAVGRGALTVLPVVPPFLRQLSASRLLERVSTATVRMITTTGDFLHDRDVEQAAQSFPAARIVPMFGLSECKRVAITPSDAGARPPGAVGRPLEGSTVAIVDPALVPLAPGAVGELVVAGSHLTHGYRGNVSATRAAFAIDPDSGLRVLRTGDLLSRDEDGWLFWHGRDADLIKASGFRISCAEIERAVGAAPDVAEVGVFGRPDPDRGQVPVAVVRLADRSDVADSDGADQADDVGRRIREAAARVLPRWAIPVIEPATGALPRTRHGKLDRSRLAAMYGGAPSGHPADPAADRPRRRAIRLLRPDAARQVPASRRFIACHTQAFLSAFRLPYQVSSEEFELLTSVPFGVRHVPGDLNRCVVPHLDPDVGLDRALALLGIELQLAHEDGVEAAPAAFERLDRWLRTGPVLLGPLDIGELRYLPYARALTGCDHYVVALEALDRGAAYVVRDPEGYVNVELSRQDLGRSWAKAAVPEGRGPYTMRRVLHRGARGPRHAAALRAEVLRHALANLADAERTIHAGADAWRRLADLDRNPSAQRSLSFLLPAAGYRAHLANLFLASDGGQVQRRMAALLEGQVAILSDMTGDLHRSGWVATAHLDAMAGLEREIADLAGSTR